jgi:hypothetical protein
LFEEERQMKRIMSAVAVLGLVVGACGGGDDPAADASEETSTETSDESAATADESTDTSDEETASDESSSEETTAEMTESTAEMTESTDETTDDGSADGDDGTDDGGGTPIRSISDVPEACREEMAEFLRAIEPIVSSINWENATLNDFEAIAEEFEAISEEFEDASAAASCDDLEFVDENEIELMIEFAQDEAPGVVGFLEFLDGMRSPGGSGEDAGSDGALETCDDALAFVQDLADTYDSMADVPASELIKMSQMSTAIMTCTPAQLELLDTGELGDFLAG